MMMSAGWIVWDMASLVLGLMVHSTSIYLFRRRQTGLNGLLLFIGTSILAGHFLVLRSIILTHSDMGLKMAYTFSLTGTYANLNLNIWRFGIFAEVLPDGIKEIIKPRVVFPSLAILLVLLNWPVFVWAAGNPAFARNVWMQEWAAKGYALWFALTLALELPVLIKSFLIVDSIHHSKDFVIKAKGSNLFRNMSIASLEAIGLTQTISVVVILRSAATQQFPFVGANILPCWFLGWSKVFATIIYIRAIVGYITGNMLGGKKSGESAEPKNPPSTPSAPASSTMQKPTSSGVDVLATTVPETHVGSQEV